MIENNIITVFIVNDGEKSLVLIPVFIRNIKHYFDFLNLHNLPFIQVTVFDGLFQFRITFGETSNCQETGRIKLSFSFPECLPSSGHSDKMVCFLSLLPSKFCEKVKNFFHSFLSCWFFFLFHILNPFHSQSQ